MYQWAIYDPDKFWKGARLDVINGPYTFRTEDILPTDILELKELVESKNISLGTGDWLIIGVNCNQIQAVYRFRVTWPAVPQVHWDYIS